MQKKKNIPLKEKNLSQKSEPMKGQRLVLHHFYSGTRRLPRYYRLFSTKTTLSSSTEQKEPSSTPSSGQQPRKLLRNELFPSIVYSKKYFVI